MNDRKGYSWLVWNLPNLLSFSRFLAPINFFVVDIFWGGWELKEKLIVYAILFLTDFMDGTIARWIGNNNGIGKLIDPVADKVMQLSGLAFLLVNVPLENWIVIPVLGGEIPILFFSLYGVYMIIKSEVKENKIITSAFKKYREEAREKKNKGEKAVEELGEFWHAVKYFPREIYLKVRERIIKEIKISAFGKMKMFAYFFGVVALIFHTIYGYRLWQGYVILFSVGFVFCLLSYKEYYQKFDNWQKKYFNSLERD